MNARRPEPPDRVRAVWRVRQMSRQMTRSCPSADAAMAMMSSGTARPAIVVAAPAPDPPTNWWDPG
jgi:hypothetical protein